MESHEGMKTRTWKAELIPVYLELSPHMLSLFVGYWSLVVGIDQWKVVGDGSC